MTAPSLPEFILARVAEWERRARIYGRKGMTTRLRDLAERNAQQYGGPHPPELDVSPPDALWWNARDVADYADQFDPARVLRQCRAIRNIVEWDKQQPTNSCVLPMLASVWADHPDYSQEFSDDFEWFDNLS